MTSTVRRSSTLSVRPAERTALNPCAAGTQAPARPAELAPYAPGAAPFVTVVRIRVDLMGRGCGTASGTRLSPHSGARPGRRNMPASAARAPRSRTPGPPPLSPGVRASTVLGRRTGYGDQEARARHEVTPARLSEAPGCPTRRNGGAWSPTTPKSWPRTTTRTSGAGQCSPTHPPTHRHGARRITCVGTGPGPRPGGPDRRPGRQRDPAETFVSLGAWDVRVLAAESDASTEDR